MIKTIYLYSYKKNLFQNFSSNNCIPSSNKIAECCENTYVLLQFKTK